jgi:hypothetical protein
VDLLIERLRRRARRLRWRRGRRRCGSAADRVQAADTAQLKRWLLRVVTAADLADVLADP